jgi:hypothetical protein
MPTVKVRNLKNKEVGDVVRERRRRRPAGMFRVRAASFGSRRERAVLVSHRFARRFGKAAVMSTVLSHATGRTRCQRRCAAVLCGRLCRNDFVKAT